MTVRGYIAIWKDWSLEMFIIHRMAWVELGASAYFVLSVTLGKKICIRILGQYGCNEIRDIRRLKICVFLFQ